MPFEGLSLLGSKKIKEYLEYRYGDYMKLPPIEERIGHNIVAYIKDGVDIDLNG